jgi:hypothetical protein
VGGHDEGRFLCNANSNLDVVAPYRSNTYNKASRVNVPCCFTLIAHPRCTTNMLASMPNIATAAISMPVYALSETRMLDLGQLFKTRGIHWGYGSRRLFRQCQRSK